MGADGGDEALRDSEEFYRAMWEVNAAVKLLIDPTDGKIIDANPAAVQFYGWTLAELREKHIDEINTLSPEEIRDAMERARTLQSQSFRFRHRIANGAVRDVDVYSGPVMLRGRELLLSILHDVTDRVRLEEQLRHAQRLDANSRLAAGVAHDFNNLLTIALASVELAERKLVAGHPAHEHLRDVRLTVQHGADLTRQMLAFAREQELAPVAVDLGRMVRRIAAMLSRIFGERYVVTASAPQNLPPAFVDPKPLELAFINLAINARDAMPDGGKLTLTASATADRIHVAISDTGQGMSEQARSHMFEPFYTTKPAGKGTGLGLSTVYGLISQSDGTLRIDSAPGEGTTVHVELPIANTKAPDSDRYPRMQPRAVKTVLLVDDHDDVRSALANALDDAGLVVYTAASASAAMERVSELDGAIDVVLSDVTMPGRSGVELAADMHARWPALPVVLMSGNRGLDDRSSGIAGWLEKPFSIDEVVATLDRVVIA